MANSRYKLLRNMKKDELVTIICGICGDYNLWCCSTCGEFNLKGHICWKCKSDCSNGENSRDAMEDE